MKSLLITDPGIDGASRRWPALFDPNLQVLGPATTPGNTTAEPANDKCHSLSEQLDPPRWPRLGAAPAVACDLDGRSLHGPNGFGGASFPCSTLHHLQPSEKLVGEFVKQFPEQVTIVCMGPWTVLARAMDIYPELPSQVKRIICLGGTVREPGNAGAVTEFHFVCDPLSARQVIRCGAPLVLIPLDLMRQVLFSPTDLLGLPADGSCLRLPPPDRS